ncbi:hypothetical protein EFN17_03155 [Propionibacterium freudenreichii]|nr:hypothetical protein [Propionibacterium freudenreichii]PWM99979.1 MAG: hypothetical protein DBX96_01210 [Propionibacterium sp.]
MQDEPTLSRVLLGLGSPEYMSSPEGLMSALAWRGDSLRAEKSAVGLIYEGKTTRSPRRTVIETRPAREADSQHLARALRDSGLSIDLDSLRDDWILPEAIFNSVRGARAKASKARTVAPMTPGLARLQNPVGMVNKNNPAPYGRIIEMMFLYGSPSQEETPRPLARDRWLQSTADQLRGNSLLAAIDSLSIAVLNDRLRDTGIEVVKSSGEQPLTEPPARVQSAETPYKWFNHAWTLLTREDWRKALSPRVWTDWLLTVLRMAFSMGFLWEMRYYGSIGHWILGGSNDRLEQFLDGTIPLIPWVDSSTPNSQRNVHPIIRDVVRQGIAVREFLRDQQGNHGDELLTDAVSIIRSNAQSMSELESLFVDIRQNDARGAKTMYESIFYSLRERESSDGGQDYYALIRKMSNRTAVISPGVEWIALMASIACGNPGGEANLRELNAQLNQVGLHPPVHDLIHLLEIAGLANGSADADEGVRIQSAY